MPTNDPTGLVDYVVKGGLSTVVGVFFWLLYTRKLRWSGEVDDIRAAHVVVIDILKARITELTEDLNEYKKLVINSQQMASKTVDLASEIQEKPRAR
jgi:hypothetical protein